MYQCLNSSKYISKYRVHDGFNDCDYNDDENPDVHYARKHISFETICDGFTELIPVTFNQINETDETECEYWPCNNIYTRCNGFWNCFDGVDEIDCNSSSLLNCSPHHHLCVPSVTNQLIRLSLEKTNDGKINCLDATDEPKLCRSNNYLPISYNFHRRNHRDQSCIALKYVCDRFEQCTYGDNEQVCSNNWNWSTPWYNVCANKMYIGSN
ncbi:unnamed protein product [Rotaria sp. Silwood2]|nr:unnamed protein product [Rotaria sp. Silwood2]CAF2978259.1 unnamed protein product [Rotaria sp. Silwood2]CAF3283655.1 unnamed protein product [Rotaria sp. Silwood2]CAF4060041.1 unnamed protein product [Rotaria sp. Silwood2]CAF4078931.1 unnamed protein product [Rotaria sp. Silwood2]